MIHCESCHAPVPDIGAAIDAGWVLYMDGSVVCGDCEHQWFAMLDQLCVAPAEADLADVPVIVEKKP